MKKINTYLMTIKIEFDAFDDIEARQISKSISSGENGTAINFASEIKLQKIFDDKPPKGIEL